MFTYYFELALRSLKRNVSLTVLMILAIAFGVGASMTTLTVMHVLAADPIPAKSKQLYYVQLDPRQLPGYIPGEEPEGQLTRRDAEALLRAKKADRQVMMTAGEAAIEPQKAGLEPFYTEARWTSADFFPMFQVPFVAGGPWTASDDEHLSRVVVISRALSDKLFGTIDVVGRSIKVGGIDMRILGVIDTWRPVPHFYDLTVRGAYNKSEELFAPFSTSREQKWDRSGNMNCWGPHEDSEAVGAPCAWIQYWVELDSESKAVAYRDFLEQYSLDELRSGRYERPPGIRMRNVIDYLDFHEVIPKDVRLQTWIALGFLLVCLINTVGLLLTKFLRRSSEIGVRRALGASKRSIFTQLLIESGTIGMVGGVCGLGLAWLGLWAVRQQPATYADLAQLDLPMLLATFALAVLSSLLAGVVPAWRGCQITPAIQLKSH